MSSRELLWLAGVALVALALLLTDRLLWQPGLTEANVRRLRPGMPLAEVEALLGGPATETIDRQAEGSIISAVRRRRADPRTCHVCQDAVGTGTRTMEV